MFAFGGDGGERRGRVIGVTGGWEVGVIERCLEVLWEWGGGEKCVCLWGM